MIRRLITSISVEFGGSGSRHSRQGRGELTKGIDCAIDVRDAKDKRMRRRCWRANLVGMFVVVGLSVIKRGRKGIEHYRTILSAKN